jgi:hypothetical protein
MGLELIFLLLAHWQKARGSAAANVSDMPGRRRHHHAGERLCRGASSWEGHHRQRRSKRADALIAGAYFAGTNKRRVRRALAALFGGAAGKDTGSRFGRKAKGLWDAWNGRSLADEPIVRLILDGMVVRVRLDRQANDFSAGRAGRPQDAQKILLAGGRVRRPGGRSSRSRQNVACERGGGRNRLPDGDLGVS